MRSDADRAGFVAAVLVGAMLCGGHTLFAQKRRDPVLGMWELNRAKSTFSGNVPESRVIRYEAASGGAIREISVTREANGGSDEVAYTAREDEKDYPISNSVLDMIALKRVDDRTVERLGKVQGRVVETRTRVLSSDGKTLTITTRGTNRGVPYQSVQVFDRVPDAAR